MSHYVMWSEQLTPTYMMWSCRTLKRVFTMEDFMNHLKMRPILEPIIVESAGNFKVGHVVIRLHSKHIHSPLNA